MGVNLAALGASYAYPGAPPESPPVFSGIDMEAKPGEVFSILGKNGAGKSTLLACLAGLRPLRSGKVLVNGRDMAALARGEIARTIAYAPQAHQAVFAFTALEAVLMGRAPHLGYFASPGRRDREIALESLRAMGVDHLADKPYTETSGGERQLILFARILAQEPQILLLDEPTSHLDFGNQVQTLERIRKLADQGMAVVMTTHFPGHAFLARGRAAILSGGRFTAMGKPEEALTEETLREAYGVPVRLADIPGCGRVCAPRLESETTKGDDGCMP